MHAYEPPHHRCTECGRDITGGAMVRAGEPFCCTGCIAGRACACDDVAPEPRLRVRHCLDVEVAGERMEPAPTRRSRTRVLVGAA